MRLIHMKVSYFWTTNVKYQRFHLAHSHIYLKYITPRHSHLFPQLVFPLLLPPEAN